MKRATLSNAPAIFVLSLLLGGQAAAGERPRLGRLAPVARLAKPKPALPQKPQEPPCGGIYGVSRRAPAFAPGEELSYELTFGPAFIGRFETKVGQPRILDGQQVLPLFGRARTSAFVAAFKTFEGRYMSMVDAQSLVPRGLRVESTYGDELRWEKVRFDRNQRHVDAQFTLEGQERQREWQSDHALTDLLAMLYAARTVVVHDGMKACQDVFGARRLWRMEATVAGKTQIKTPAGKRDAYVVKSVFVRRPHPELPGKAPRIELDVYLSTDPTQTPLRFVARTEGIEAEGNLVSWSMQGKSKEQDWSL